MKRQKWRVIIGVVALLLAVTLLTGVASPPPVEVEVPLMDFPWWLPLAFFGLPVLVIGFIILIVWILLRVFRKESPEQKLAGEEWQAKIGEQQDRKDKIREHRQSQKDDHSQ